MNAVPFSQGPTMTSLIMGGNRFCNSPSRSWRWQPICRQANNLAARDRICTTSPAGPARAAKTCSVLHSFLSSREVRLAWFLFAADASLECSVSQNRCAECKWTLGIFCCGNGSSTMTWAEYEWRGWLNAQRRACSFTKQHKWPATHTTWVVRLSHKTPVIPHWRRDLCDGSNRQYLLVLVCTFSSGGRGVLRAFIEVKVLILQYQVLLWKCYLSKGM